MSEEKSKPYLIITNGATGSGKTGLVTKTKEYYKLKGRHRKILIDDLIENNSVYKERIDAIIESECKSKTLCNALKDRLLNPDDEFTKKFGNSYFEVRKGKYCGSKVKTCDEVLDDMLEKSITRGDNIVFETVGTYYVQWLIDKIPKQKSYEIYYTFSILQFCENVKRNKTRALHQMEEYLEDSKLNPAPRLPDVRPTKMSETLSKIVDNLFNLIAQKITGRLEDIHHIFVVDNTSKDLVVIYDSDKNKLIGDVMSKIQLLVSEKSC